MNDTCPNCGYCKHCGRGNYYSQPWSRPYYQPYTVWCGTQTGLTGQLTTQGSTSFAESLGKMVQKDNQ